MGRKIIKFHDQFKLDMQYDHIITQWLFLQIFLETIF